MIKIGFPEFRFSLKLGKILAEKIFQRDSHKDRKRKKMRKVQNDWEIYLQSAAQASGSNTSEQSDDIKPQHEMGFVKGLVDEVKTDISDFIHRFESHVDHLKIANLIWPNLPAVPISLKETIEASARLLVREFQAKQASQGMTNVYTIGGVTTFGHDFLHNKTASSDRVKALTSLSSTLNPHSFSAFAGAMENSVKEELAPLIESPDPTDLTRLSLEHPEQWTITWTTFPQVYQPAHAKGLDTTWASALTSAEAATQQFWPMIAEYGMAFYLLILEKLDDARLSDMKSIFAGIWTEELTQKYHDGLLFMIDQRRFETLDPQTVKGFPRFTPATVVLLVQDPATKDLTPIAVRVSGKSGAGAQIYSRLHGTTDSAWIYALSAARVSITVYGIWIGHVYHWHLVTAAMQMTMYNNIEKSNPVYELLQPQSNYLIGFDDVLMLTWPASAPPTSISSPKQFLDLMNDYAKGREFFEDDPINMLARNGIQVSDFSVNTPWDKYPIVGQNLEVWSACSEYVTQVVQESYPTDSSVADDRQIEAWIKDSSAHLGGNIRGLPVVKTRQALTDVLTSLIFRVTVHGCARLNSAANPALSFMSNYPPCLQNAEILPPSAKLDTKSFLGYLPNTGTISKMNQFLSIFAYSVPYEPLIPLEGIESSEKLFFGPDPTSPRNQALIRFRHRMLKLLVAIDDGIPQVFQWPLNIET